MEVSEVQCQVCTRHGSSTLLFNCLTCARNVLYEPRVRHVQSLLSKEALGREVEQALKTGRGYKGVQWRDRSGEEPLSSSHVACDCAACRLSETIERTQNTLSQAKALKEHIQQMNMDIAKQRAAFEQRRSALSAVRRDLTQEHTKATEPVQKVSVNTNQLWNTLHTETVKSRVFLCREVASLYGLQQKKRRKGVSGRDSYLIGGVPIVDIRDINSQSSHHCLPVRVYYMEANISEDATPSQITVSTACLAHFLHLISHYLAVRLPAEIALPDATHTYPQIFSPLSSYHSPTVPYPLSKTSPTSSASNTARPAPRSRPLYIDKPPLALAAEDPIAYAQFIEAITLLAWDIAWLCKTQGLDVSARSWEDVCAMGKNMWLLFVAPPTKASTSRITTPSTDINTEATSASPMSPPKVLVGKAIEKAQPQERPAPPLGHFSHGTNHSFLNAAEGGENMRNWKLASPMRVIEKVKAALASERMGAEWEVLEEGEWEDASAANTGEVAVGKNLLSAQTGGSISPKLGELLPVVGERRSSEPPDEAKEKGRSGWMKVKSRGTES